MNTPNRPPQGLIASGFTSAPVRKPGEHSDPYRPAPSKTMQRWDKVSSRPLGTPEAKHETRDIRPKVRKAGAESWQRLDKR